MTGLDIIKKDLNKLDSIIKIYREELKSADDVIELRNKRIDIANAEQSGWANYYHEKEIEVKHIKDYIYMKTQEVHGTLWQKYTEKMNIALANKDKEEYIKSDPIYLNILEQYLKIQELHDHFIRLNDSFDTRGYALNNLTKLVIAQNSEWVIP